MKKGFTLIELLAVILILGIIALIAIPQITNVIEDARINALKVSASVLVDAANLYAAQYRPTNIVRFDIIDNDIISTEKDKLKYTGKVENGVLIVTPNMKVIVCLTDGKNSAYKNMNDSKVTLDRNKVCNITYDSTDLDIIDNDKPTDLVLNTVSQLKTETSLIKDKTVKTRGFYSTNDGGGAYYTITDEDIESDDMTVIALNNGLKAKLTIESRMDVKQFGAKGDGATDDHLAFEKILSQEIDTITISKGTYNLNNSILTTNKFVQLLGDGQNKTTIKNGTFKTVYGISAANITFDGGAEQWVDYVGADSFDETGTIAFIVSPNKECDVIYKNCTFKNVTVASFAADEPGKDRFGQIRYLPLGSLIRNNVVDNCTFTDIGKIAIYHSVTTRTNTFTNNTFVNMGNLNLLKGEVGALFIGDITNNTRYEASSILIQNNTFKNLMTKDDFDESVHFINANFIAIKADKAVIDNNTFTDLIGYGHDREGVYTKVRDLTISNNKLTNAGLGEGYVCAKAHDGVVFNNIINNTFVGDAGTAIRNYGPGLIEGNTINISNVYTAITSTQSGTITVANNGLTIKGNRFNAGRIGTLTINGTTISYGKNRIVAISDVHMPIVIENNIFSPTTNFDTYMSIGNPGNSIQILNNTFSLSDKTGTGIYIGSNSNGFTHSLNNNTVISGNHFNGASGFKPVKTQFVHSTDYVSNRTLSFLNNEVNNAGSSKVNVLTCYVKDSVDSNIIAVNEDTLIVNGNTCNRSKANTVIKSQMKYYETQDLDFATVN